MQDHFKTVFPKTAGDGDFAYLQTTRAKSFDAIRGMLPAASLSNVGIYSTGQGYVSLLMRMRAHQLPEARQYAEMMLSELRKVIPSFLRRVDIDDRGVAWSKYFETNQLAMESVAASVLSPTVDTEDTGVDLVSWDPDAEVNLVTAMLYPFASMSERRISDQVHKMSLDDRLSVIRAYVGDRGNRRHKPGRALERVSYRFDVLSDYGAFRDLQRHRMLTVEWQNLSPTHGYVRPRDVDDAGVAEVFDRVMDRSAALYEDLEQVFPRQAPYAVAMAFRVRYSMQMNAREALHLIELRSAPQGHPSYRSIAQQMYREIAETAGHRAVAEMFRYIDMSDGESGRIEAERRTEQRRYETT